MSTGRLTIIIAALLTAVLFGMWLESKKAKGEEPSSQSEWSPPVHMAVAEPALGEEILLYNYERGREVVVVPLPSSASTCAFDVDSFKYPGVRFYHSPPTRIEIEGSDVVAWCRPDGSLALLYDSGTGWELVSGVPRVEDEEHPTWRPEKRSCRPISSPSEVMPGEEIVEDPSTGEAMGLSTGFIACR